ncbi:hypothetical protein TWF506_003866 [Arthrobotrys conoides]|uniref:Uncharacterized protein n=1 Tax=Arthrobotrys conoides TaxID=74498 RepID=A0AAN8RIG5_9PEZI
MDPNQINHAQAWAWQLNEQQMADKENEGGFEKQPFQYPNEPGIPMPNNPIFFNMSDQGMNLNNMPLYNYLPQYQQLLPGDVQMGMELHPPMQTPMDVNTGIFMQEPLPVEQLMQPMGMDTGMDLDGPVTGSQALPETPDQSAVPSLEDPIFHPSGSTPPQSAMQNPSVQQGLLGQLPNIPMPEKSLFMQSMTPPRGMPQHVFMMLKQQQQQQMALDWQMGGFNPPSGLSMQQMQQPRMHISQMRMPQMNMSPMQIPPMQMSQMQMSQMQMMPQMPQMQMSQLSMAGTPQMQSSLCTSPSAMIVPSTLQTPSPMDLPGTPQLAQTSPPTEGPQASNSARKVRFQGFSDIDPSGNPFNPDTRGSNNKTAAPKRPPKGATTPKHKIVRKRATKGSTGNTFVSSGYETSSTPIPATNIPQVPKAVVQISQEPFSRTFPPNVAYENLKKGNEPPSNGQYPGGKMTVKDHQEYRSNMVYLGNPIGQPKDRIPAPLAHLGPVPQFGGNPDDLGAVKEHLNILTDWTNQYVHAAMNTVARYNTHTENLTKQLKDFELEKKQITNVIKEVHQDEELSIPDFIRNTKINISKLEESVELLNYHHKDCEKAPRNLETLNCAAGSDKTALELQKSISDRRMVELETVRIALQDKNEILKAKNEDLRQAKDLVITYQVQIQELVNKENFNRVAKVRVLQQLVDTRDAARRLEIRYSNLFEKAKEISRDAQALKTITGWIEEIPNHGKGDVTEETLSSRYQVLLQHSKYVVSENAKLKEQLKAQKSILELQAEYDKLKAEKDKVETTLGAVKEIQGHIKMAEAAKMGFAKAKTAWDAEKARLQLDLDQCQGIISHSKTQQDDVAKKQKTQEKTIKNLQAKNKKAEMEHQKVKEEFNKLKSEYEKFMEEKEQIEIKTTKLMDLHRLVVAENATLKERRLARQIELEAMKKRLREGGAEKIIRIDAPGSKKGHECLLTRGELMEILGQADFREYMHSYLKAIDSFNHL